MQAVNGASTRNIGIAVLALLASISLVYAQRTQDSRHDDPAPRNEPAPWNEPAPRGVTAHAPAERPAVVVDRVNHGTIRHVDTHVVERPVEVRRETEIRPKEAHRAPEVRPNVSRHRDVEVDVDHKRFWNDFVFGRRHPALRDGCLRLQVGVVSYYYDSGIYYQQADDGYQEVYPPTGAVVPELPDGAIAIEAGNLVYYYVGGAFYVQQAGGFVIAPPPMGVTVPELPPGAVAVSINGNVAYQFNGIYYQPVFVDGVTQYTTFLP